MMVDLGLDRVPPTGDVTCRRSAPDDLADGDRIIVPGTVMMELPSGPTEEAVAARRRRMLEAFDVEPLVPVADSLRAVSLQRTCRRTSETVRSLGDCLIAATALRLDEHVVHRDRDFEVLAQHSALHTVSLLRL